MERISPGEQAPEVYGRQEPDLGRLCDLQVKLENLERAVASQRTIGIAIGILAERYGCTASDAWAYLRRLSQSTNIKVRDIARVLQDACDGSLRESDAQLAATLDGQLPGGLRSRGGSTR